MVAILTNEQVKWLQNNVDKEEYDQLHEGASPTRDEAFSIEVYQRRLWNLQGKMQENGIDIALLVSPEAQCWLHGYKARWYRAETSTEWPPCNFTAVYAPSITERPSISYDDQLTTGQRIMLEETWSNNLLVFDSSDHERLLELTSSVSRSQFRYFDLPDKNANPDDADTSLKGVCGFVLNVLKEEKWIESRITDQWPEIETKILGLELCSHRQNVAVTDSLREAIGSYKIKIKEGKEEGDREKYISGMLRGLQTIKEPAELKWIRDAGKILDAAYKHLMEDELRWKRTETSLPTLQVGLVPEMTELQVWAEMEWAMAQLGGESAGLHNTVSKSRSYCHALSSTRRIGDGALLLDPSGVKHRYHANTARTFYVGDKAPPLALIKASLIAGGAIEILKEKCKEILLYNEKNTIPKTFADLNQELLKYYKSFKIKNDADVTIWDRRDWIGGYQLGISFPPDWVGEFSWNVVTAEAADKDQIFEHLSVEDDKKIVPGLVTNFESFIGGYGFIDTIIFKDDGIEVVSQHSQTLYLVHLERHTTFADVENYQVFAETYPLGKPNS